MANLFNLTQRYLQLQEMLEENEGELTPEINEALFENKEGIKDHANFLHLLRVKAIGEAKTIAGEVERLNDAIARKEKGIAKLEETLVHILQTFGENDIDKKTGNSIYRLDTGYVKLSTRRSVSTETIPTFHIPEYMRYSTSLNSLDNTTAERVKELLEPLLNIDMKEAPNKTKIKEDIEAGKEVDGAWLETKYSLNKPK